MNLQRAKNIAQYSNECPKDVKPCRWRGILKYLQADQVPMPLAKEGQLSLIVQCSGVPITTQTGQEPCTTISTKTN